MEITVIAPRLLTVKVADKLVGTFPDQPRSPSFASPRRPGDVVRVETPEGETVAVVTKLPRELLEPLRTIVTGLKYGQGAARHRMSSAAMTFGYAPPKAIAQQEGCRATVIGRDHPEAEAVLDRVADHLADEFELVLPQQAALDEHVVTGSVLNEWRIGSKALWTSGVINQMNVLPYHRDRNNLAMWSAMPTVRSAMGGGRLHLPEFDLTFPCGDGDVTWFYGRGLVHGNTPLERRKPGGYRYSIVYYALKGMVDCATYAEETARAQRRRTQRERGWAAQLREEAK